MADEARETSFRSCAPAIAACLRFSPLQACRLATSAEHLANGIAAAGRTVFAAAPCYKIPPRIGECGSSNMRSPGCLILFWSQAEGFCTGTPDDVEPTRLNDERIIMQQAFVDYFRCPMEFADFRPLGPPVGPARFFQFGTDTICYGRISSGSPADSPGNQLDDSLASVRIEENACYLPFDPDEIIENLRHERYHRALHLNGQRSLAKSVLRNIYYTVRPLLTVPVRKHLQRAALRGWDQIPFPRWPVDHTVDRILEKMMLLALRAHKMEPMPFIWFWPDGCSSCAIVTHDVETAAGRDFCSSLMDLNDSFAIKSSFQFVPEERYTVSEEFLTGIRERGFEVNVHDLNHDGNLFRDREEFLRRAGRINGYGKKFGATGYRSAVLYRNLDWFDTFDFSYEMSVPNVGHLDPQRGGCCTTKPYFIGKILEIPVTTTQDYTLFHILQQYSMDLWEQQIQLIREQNGLLSFLVHPDYIAEKRARRIYAALLAHLVRLREEANLWIALPREVNDWWRTRSQMKLVNEEGRWRVEGEGKERARVAYATVVQGKVSYTLEKPSSNNKGSVICLQRSGSCILAG